MGWAGLRMVDDDKGSFLGGIRDMARSVVKEYSASMS